MSLSGMMRTGVSGMNAQANRLSSVSDNIANSNTTGYKRSSTEFSSLVIPSTGGNTWFTSMQAACDALPPDLRKKIEGRRVKHDGTYNSGGYLRKGVTPTDDPMAAPGAWHPAILRHPVNGRATLYLGRRRNSYVEGYSREESDAVLEALWAHVTQERFIYEHVWKLGDLVMWDNRSTMHRRDPFDSSQRRVMHRTQIKGSHRPMAFAA